MTIIVTPLPRKRKGVILHARWPPPSTPSLLLGPRSQHDSLSGEGAASPLEWPAAGEERRGQSGHQGSLRLLPALQGHLTGQGSDQGGSPGPRPSPSCLCLLVHSSLRKPVPGLRPLQGPGRRQTPPCRAHMFQRSGGSLPHFLQGTPGPPGSAHPHSRDLVVLP